MCRCTENFIFLYRPKYLSHSISLIEGPNVSSPSSVLLNTARAQAFVDSAGVGLADDEELAHDLPCFHTSAPYACSSAATQQPLRG